MENRDLPPSKDEKLKSELDTATKNYIGEKAEKRRDIKARVFAVFMLLLIFAVIGGAIGINIAFPELPSQNIMLTAFMLISGIMVGSLPWQFVRYNKYKNAKFHIPRGKFRAWGAYSIILAIGAVVGGVFAMMYISIPCLALAVIGTFFFIR